MTLYCLLSFVANFGFLIVMLFTFINRRFILFTLIFNVTFRKNEYLLQ